MNESYDIDPDAIQPQTSHGIALELAGSAQRVLDVGCSTGGVARALARRGASVVGIDIDPDSVAIATEHGVDARVWDLEAQSLSELRADGPFDAILFLDVLEHVREPHVVLSQTLDLLAPGGRVVVSLPNVAHSAIRLGLLLGRWDYRDHGLLDDTHLRFFTIDGIEDLAASAGFLVETVERTTLHIEHAGGDVPIDQLRVPGWIESAARFGPEAHTYQFVVRLLPIEPNLPSTEALRATLRDSRLRLRTALRENRHLEAERDGLIARAEAGDHDRLELLAARDRMIGLEASRSEAVRQMIEVQHDIRACRAELEHKHAEIEAIKRSPVWRVGMLITLPLRLLKRALRTSA